MKKHLCVLCEISVITRSVITYSQQCFLADMSSATRMSINYGQMKDFYVRRCVLGLLDLRRCYILRIYPLKFLCVFYLLPSFSCFLRMLRSRASEWLSKFPFPSSSPSGTCTRVRRQRQLLTDNTILSPLDT